MIEEKVTINLIEKDVKALELALNLAKRGKVPLTEDEKEAMETILKQIQEQKSYKKILEFANFLDNLYREHHDNLDRLGKAGIIKLAEVMIDHSGEVIKKLKKY